MQTPAELAESEQSIEEASIDAEQSQDMVAKEEATAEQEQVEAEEVTAESTSRGRGCRRQEAGENLRQESEVEEERYAEQEQVQVEEEIAAEQSRVKLEEEIKQSRSKCK